MKIIINQIQIQNFKGVKDLIVNFDEGQTFIYGANEVGKTTLFDAFTWLLFGKDSQDRKDFNIKNTKHPELNRQDHEVSAKFTVNEQNVGLRRIYREKWTKKKGSPTPELAGNEQEFFWNGTPMQAGEYARAISAIVEESVFKLITNPIYFNSLHWTKRREFLFKLGGNITDEEVASGHKDFETLLETFKSKSLDKWKAEIAAKKKDLKAELAAIPHRIDEVSKSLPEKRVWKEIEKSISDYNSSLSEIDHLIADRTKANQARLNDIQKKQLELHQAKSTLKSIEYQLETEHLSKSRELSKTYSNSLSLLENKISEISRNLNSKQILSKTLSEKNESFLKSKEELLKRYFEVDARVLEFQEGEFCCPTCKREFEANDIEERKATMFKNFMDDKNKALDSIEEKGNNLKKDISENSDLIDRSTAEISSLKEELKSAEDELLQFKTNAAPESVEFDLEKSVAENSEYKSAMEKVAALENVLKAANEEESNDNADLQGKKMEIISSLDKAKKEFAEKGVLEKGKKRIEELKIAEADFSQKLADLEMVEFNIDAFNKAKIEAVESRINEKFQYVSFKMFDYTLDGNPVETCETMYKGVPFSTLNNAGKVWAGLDIINTLSNHYEVSAPVFLDNRESVTEIPFTESQVVNLFVSPEDKELRVA